MLWYIAKVFERVMMTKINTRDNVNDNSFFFFPPGTYKTGVGRFPIEKSQTVN